MSNALRKMAVVAAAFIQFKLPNGDKLFLENDEAEKFGGVQHADGFARDKDGNRMPVGVRAFGPGSSQYRAAQSAAQTLGLQRGRNKMNGDLLFTQSTDTLSRTVIEYVNFDYNGKRLTGTEDLPARIALNEQLLVDLEFVGVREQIEAEQGDLANFSATPASA